MKAGCLLRAKIK